MSGRMENLMSMPLLLEMETEEGKILTEMVQLLNYICVAPTLCRQELATKLLGVAAKCMDTLNSQKLKIQTLEKQHDEVSEQPEDANECVRREGEDWEVANECTRQEERKEENWEDANERVRHEEEDRDDAVPLDCSKPQEIHADGLLRDLIDSPIGQTILSSTSVYTVEALLGTGTFGVVVQCLKKPSNETVALKVIKNRHQIPKAEEEVDMLDSLEDLGSKEFNIVSCRDRFVFNGHFCMEFQKMDVSLSDFIKAQGSLELKDIRAVLQQMTDSLCFLKEVGVVHSDLKPHNIMLVDRDHQPLKVQLIDFGEAMRDIEEWAGATFQTLLYRAPEVVLGAVSNYPIDVWSLGCIAAEMLTGTLLFDIYSDAELMHHVVSLLGQPSNEVLKRGLNTGRYFEKSSSQPAGDWVLKPLGARSPQTSPTDVQHKKLCDLLKVPTADPAEEDQAVECDRLAFLDLLEKMLNTDAWRRIRPEEILSHPFITLSHLNPESHSSYLKSSIKSMKACNNWSFDGGVNAQQPLSNTSNISNIRWEDNISNTCWEDNISSASNTRWEDNISSASNTRWEDNISNTCWEDNTFNISWKSNISNTRWEANMLMMERPLNSEEEPSLQQDFREEESSPGEIWLEDLKWPVCVSSSPEQKEETQCTTSDCSSPVKEEPRSNTPSRSRGLINRVKHLKASIIRKIQKLRSFKQP